MKKTLFLIAMVAFGLPSFSQSPVLISNFTSSDSVITNTGTATITYTATYSYPKAIVYLTVSKVSGTVAGTCICMGSNDVYGAYDTLVNEKVTPFTGGAIQAPNTVNSVYTNRDVTQQSKAFVISPAGYKYYKLFCTGSGTMVANIRGKIVGIKAED